MDSAGDFLVSIRAVEAGTANFHQADEVFILAATFGYSTLAAQARRQRNALFTRAPWLSFRG